MTIAIRRRYDSVCCFYLIENSSHHSSEIAVIVATPRRRTISTQSSMGKNLRQPTHHVELIIRTHIGDVGHAV